MTEKITIISPSGKRHEATIHERTEDTMTISLDGLPTSGTITHRLRKLIDGRWADDAGNIVPLSESHVPPPAIDYDPETGMLTVTMEHPPMEERCNMVIQRHDYLPRGYMYTTHLVGTANLRCLCGECDGEPLPLTRAALFSMVQIVAMRLDDDQARLAEMYEAQERARQAL